MPTWRTSARNQFRTPSGVPGDPADGPGGMAALSDDVDAFLGIGGAEYCANAAAITAIPSSRKFIGKLAYAADTGITWRYVGAGNGPISLLAGVNATTQWTAWHKAAATFAPAWTNITFTTPTSNLGLYGITAGVLWVDAFTQAGATAPTLSASLDASLALPLQAVVQFGEGGGTWSTGGSSAANNQHDLYAYTTGSPIGGATSTLRVRARVASAAGASVKQNGGLGTYITAAASDWINVHFRGVCANLVA